MRPPVERIAVRTSLIYAGVAGLWILLSDKVLDLLVTDPVVMGQIQTYKGGAFVAVTAVLLYLGLTAELHRKNRQEEELTQSEVARDRSLSLMTATLESTKDGIFVVNRERRIETFNALFVRMWQLEPETLAQGDAEVALAGTLTQVREPDTVREQTRRAYDNPEAETFDVLELKDGRAIERYSRPQKVGGKVVGRVWSFRDITERRRAEADLRESEQRFRRLIEHAPEAVVLLDVATGRFVQVNAAAERLFKLDAAELCRRGPVEMSPPRQPDGTPSEEKVRTYVGQALAGQVPVFEWMHCDGGQIEILCEVRLLRVDLGGREVVRGSITEITERKRVEAELRWRTAFFEAQLESSMDGILVVDEAGRKIVQNRRLAEMWQIPAEYATEKDDTRQVRYCTLRTRNPQQFIAKVEYLYAHPHEVSHDEIELVDGTVFSRYSAGVWDRGGRYFGRIWAFRDITGQRRAQEQIRHLANFPELNPNPVLEFSAAGNLVYQNPAAVQMAGKVGMPEIARLLPPETRQIVADCLATGQPRLRLETVHSRHTLSWSFYPIASQHVVHCYVGDVTDRLQLEEQLRQAQKMDAIGQLAGGVAHDFNNLLTAIIGHLGMLQPNPGVTPEMAESLEQIGEAANRAANLTSQLLAFSRRQVISASILDMNDVVQKLTRMLRRVLGEDIAMQVDYAPEQLAFRGDAGMIDQVLLNLTVNARDAMPRGGTLRIQTRAGRTADGSGELVHLTVSDTGAGISAEVLPRIFEPFFTTKEVGKGTGLGLATVFGIVQQHEGHIDVESEVGHGTTFHVTLPRLAAAVAEPAPLAPPPAAKGRGETILLVEDEPAVQQVGVVTLRRHGYQVLAASDGPGALALWSQHKEEIALLLTDLIMPGGISGLELARQLCAEKPGLRVLYTSGYSAEIAGRDLPLRDGVNYLAKPYELDRLFRTVRAALDGEGSRAPF